MTTITLSSRGQIVIPADIRKRLGLNVGDQLTVEVNEENSEITLQRAESIEEMAARFTSWIQPDTPPLMDTGELYSTRDFRA